MVIIQWLKESSVVLPAVRCLMWRWDISQTQNADSDANEHDKHGTIVGAITSRQGTDLLQIDTRRYLLYSFTVDYCTSTAEEHSSIKKKKKI